MEKRTKVDLVHSQQVINIGRCYLVQSLPDPSVTTVYGGSPFWSLVADYNCGTEVESDGVQKVSAFWFTL